MDWKEISEHPERPCQVLFWAERMTFRNAITGELISPIIAPYRDERFGGTGFWDGTDWFYCGTGHRVFEFDWQESDDDSPTHWAEINAPITLEPVHHTAVETELYEALKYARRFLKPENHDTAFIDAALAKARGD